MLITYKGTKVEVLVDYTYYSNNDPIYFIYLPNKTLYLEMSEFGTWKEVEGESTDEALEIGELIENFCF